MAPSPPIDAYSENETHKREVRNFPAGAIPTPEISGNNRPVGARMDERVPVVCVRPGGRSQGLQKPNPSPWMGIQPRAARGETLYKTIYIIFCFAA